MNRKNHLQKLVGCCEIELQGTAILRFVSLLHRNNIFMEKLVFSQNSIAMTILYKDVEYCREFADKTGLSMEIKTERGVYFCVRRLRKRYGLIIGFFLYFIMLYDLCTRVTRVTIAGDIPKETRFKIEKILEEYGVAPGEKYAEWNMERLELDLRKKYPKLVWVNMHMEGCELYVDVKLSESDEEIR